jgi:hypothetical protein
VATQAPTAAPTVAPALRVATAQPSPAATAPGPAAKPAATAAAASGPRSLPSSGPGRLGGGSSPQPRVVAKPAPASPAPASPAPASPAPASKSGGSRQAAFVPRAAASAVPGNDLDKLNARLNGLLPGEKVAEYSHGERSGILDVETIPAEFLQKISPPPEILRKAIALGYRKRSAAQADSVLYVTGRRRILIEVCSGWMVELHPLGGGPPQGFPYLGPCPSDDVVPAWAGALPTLPPRRPSP